MAEESIITYERLYDLLRKEKYSQELQKSDKDFFKNIIKYLEEKTAIIEAQKSKDSIFSTEVEKTEKQLVNVKKIVKELYEKRENKIMQLALFSSRIKERDVSPALLPEEQKLFLEMVDVLNKFRGSILERVVEKRIPAIKEEKPKDIKREMNETEKGNEMKTIRLLHPVPQFVANDLNVYGPFEEEDTSVLPKKTANVLIKKKRAEEIKSEST
jgi:DNA replication initiation complex subunit (GINS family)